MSTQTATDASVPPEHAATGQGAHGEHARKNATTILMAVAIAILLGQIARGERIVHRLKSELSQAEANIASQAGAVALGRLEWHRQDVVAAAQWLDDFYRSDEGLRRPDGLWNAASRQVDAEALGAWIFDVYLKARVDGASEAVARQKVADAIRATDEWRRVHLAK